MWPEWEQYSNFLTIDVPEAKVGVSIGGKPLNRGALQGGYLLEQWNGRGQCYTWLERVLLSVDGSVERQGLKTVKTITNFALCFVCKAMG